MTESDLRQLLQGVQAGVIAPDVALRQLQSGPFRTTDLGFAQVDHHRQLRQGMGEVIFGESKTAEQILAITREAGSAGAPVLITRLQPEKLAALAHAFPTGRRNDAARTFTLHAPAPIEGVAGQPHVVVVAAGTSDHPVAEEAYEVAVAMGIPCNRIYDVGVAGLHRLLARVEVRLARGLLTERNRR